jgi:hypothetical protein
VVLEKISLAGFEWSGKRPEEKSSLQREQRAAECAEKESSEKRSAAFDRKSPSFAQAAKDGGTLKFVCGAALRGKNH